MKNSKDYEKDINFLYNLQIELDYIISQNREYLEDYDNEENRNDLSMNKDYLESLLSEYLKYYKKNIKNQYSEDFIESQFNEIINESSFLNEIEYI